MTFSIIQHDANSQRIVGTLWAHDESGAQSLAPIFFPSAGDLKHTVQRADDREIPLCVRLPVRSLSLR